MHARSCCDVMTPRRREATRRNENVLIFFFRVTSQCHDSENGLYRRTRIVRVHQIFVIAFEHENYMPEI